MSYNYSQQGDHFDDLYDDLQHRNQYQQQADVDQTRNQLWYPQNRQHEMQQDQQQGQFTYQAHQPQQYSYQQLAHQTFQQHQQLSASSPYTDLGKQPNQHHPQQPPPLPILMPLPTPPLPIPVSLPTPPPPIPYHQNQKDPQQQLPMPTDPRNGSASSHAGQKKKKNKKKNNNNNNNNNNTSHDKRKEEKKRKRTEKNAKRKLLRKKWKAENAHRTRAINLNVDSGLAEFTKAFKIAEYNRVSRKCNIRFPMIDKYHDTNDVTQMGKICLAYHCFGACSHSHRNESHRDLSPSERQRFYDYLNEVKAKIMEEKSVGTKKKAKSNGYDPEIILPSTAKTTMGRMTRSKTKAIREIEASIESDKRKADDSGMDSKQSDSNKRQRLDLDDDGIFADCPDDDEIQVLGTIGTPATNTLSPLDNDGTAVNPVDLTDSITPMTRELHTGLTPGSKSQTDSNNENLNSIMVSLSSSLDLDQGSNTTALSVPTASSDDGISAAQTHQQLPTDTFDATTVEEVTSPSVDQNVGNRFNTKLPKKPTNPSQIDRTTAPQEESQKEVLSPNSKSRRLKKLKAQLELAKKQHELAKLKEGLRKRDHELQKQRNKDCIRAKPLAPISALSASLIIENINETGPEHMVYFPNSQLDNDLQLTQYKAILYGDKEEEEATEALSTRKKQIERDLAVLKERLESSFPTVEAASMSREDLQRKLEEAQANKDISYWKLFVSKQEHILSNVENQIKENSASLKQCTEEMENVERDSRHALKTMKVLEIREATLTEMAAKSSLKILQMRQRLHQGHTKDDR